SPSVLWVIARLAQFKVGKYLHPPQTSHILLQLLNFGCMLCWDDRSGFTPLYPRKRQLAQSPGTAQIRMFGIWHQPAIRDTSQGNDYAVLPQPGRDTHLIVPAAVLAGHAAGVASAE